MRNNVVLVTGGLGFIGSHIVAALIEDNGDDACGFIVVVDNHSTCARPEYVESVLKDMIGSGAKKKKSISFVLADVCDRDAMQKVFQSFPIDCVIHCAGVKSVSESMSDPLKYYRINVNGTATLLSAMADGNQACNRFIFSSSATVYGEPKTVPVSEETVVEPINPYGRSKAMAEHIISDWQGTNASVHSAALLRYMNPVGAHVSGALGEDPLGEPANLQPYIAQVALGVRPHLRIFGNDYPTRDGTGVRDYIHVMDLAEAHVAAMKKTCNGLFEEVNIGRGVGVSVLEMLHAFEKACGKSIPYKICERRDGDSAEVYCDAKLVLKLFGWSAKRSVDEMCESTWYYLMQQEGKEEQKQKDEEDKEKKVVPVRVYVAGGWRFRYDIKIVMDQLRGDQRFKVVSGWVEREDGENSPKALGNCAECDIDEVSSADVVLAIMNDEEYAYRGTFTEIGCALGQKKPVVIVCPGTTRSLKVIEDNDGNDGIEHFGYSHYCQNNVFYHHPLATHVESTIDAKEALIDAVAVNAK